MEESIALRVGVGATQQKMANFQGHQGTSIHVSDEQRAVEESHRKKIAAEAHEHKRKEVHSRKEKAEASEAKTRADAVQREEDAAKDRAAKAEVVAQRIDKAAKQSQKEATERAEATRKVAEHKQAQCEQRRREAADHKQTQCEQRRREAAEQKMKKALATSNPPSVSLAMYRQARGEAETEEQYHTFLAGLHAASCTCVSCMKNQNSKSKRSSMFCLCFPIGKASRQQAAQNINKFGMLEENTQK